MNLGCIVNPVFRAVIENTFDADAALDAALFVSRLTKDAIFQIGGNASIVRRDAIKQAVSAIFDGLLSARHKLVTAYELETVFIYEAVVTYVFKNCQEADIPYANILEFDREQVRRYRIYLDMPK